MVNVLTHLIILQAHQAQDLDQDLGQDQVPQVVFQHKLDTLFQRLIKLHSLMIKIVSHKSNLGSA